MPPKNDSFEEEEEGDNSVIIGLFIIALFATAFYLLLGGEGEGEGEGGSGNPPVVPEECTGGQVLINGVCGNPPVVPVECINGQILINGVCGNPPVVPVECTGGQVFENGSCSDPTCTGGQVFTNGSCSDPTCTGGQVFTNGSCSDPTCTGGQVFTNGRCQVHRTQKQIDCKNALNITNYNETPVVCPPGYNLGGWKFTQGPKICSMEDSTKPDCGWGSCNPTGYEIPNYGKWPNIKKGDPRQNTEFTDTGSYKYATYGRTTEKPAGHTYYMTHGTVYDEAKYCPA
jgi:hypothetical protein